MTEIIEITQVAPTRILVVDDDDAFRESVCAAIARDPDMVLAAQGNAVAAAREAIAHVDFDVALIDLGLPDGNGIDLIREISRTLPDVAHHFAHHIRCNAATPWNHGRFHGNPAAKRVAALRVRGSK